jgi:hypothetical protein
MGLLTHSLCGAESFLRSQQVLSWSINSPQFIESTFTIPRHLSLSRARALHFTGPRHLSLSRARAPHSQYPATCPYPEPEPHIYRPPPPVPIQSQSPTFTGPRHLSLSRARAPHSQAPATCPYPEPEPHIPCVKSQDLFPSLVSYQRISQVRSLAKCFVMLKFLRR